MSEQQENNKLGLSGSIAKKFLLSEITPLLAVIAFLLGVFAVIITPREEEPQINVTFAIYLFLFLVLLPKKLSNSLVHLPNKYFLNLKALNIFIPYPNRACQY